MGTKVIGCRLPNEVQDEFAIRCEAEGVRVSEKLRQLVDDYMYPSTPRLTVRELYDMIEDLQEEIMDIISVLSGRGKVWIEDTPDAPIDPEIGVAPTSVIHWEIEKSDVDKKNTKVDLDKFRKFIRNN